jgi:hypothetical protein
MKMAIKDEIEARLQAAFAVSELVVVNESHRHAGHGGDDGSGESHFAVKIRAPELAAMGLAFGRMSEPWQTVLWHRLVELEPTASIAPLMGAALPGSGVAASGRWPSPAKRPEVGSSPIQPAPGM